MRCCFTKARLHLFFTIKMSGCKLWPKIFTNYKQKAIESYRNFHVAPVSNSEGWHSYYSNRPEYDNALFYTNLPNKRRERRVKVVTDLKPRGRLIIQCKKEYLNHYSGTMYGKFQPVPLASKGWMRGKSNGDSFTILTEERYSQFSTEEVPPTFEQCGLSENVINQLKNINVETPTAIQAKVLNKLLSGMNVFMFAECGSGKTLAYMASMIQNVLDCKPGTTDTTVNEPLGVILLSTPELAVQVLKMATSIGSDLGIDFVGLIEGGSSDILEKPTMHPVDILITTFPALLKHMQRRIYSLKRCRHVVIDDIDVFEIGKKFEMVQRFFTRSKLSFTGLNMPSPALNSAQVCFVSSVTPSTLGKKMSEFIELNEIETVSTSQINRVLRNVPQQFLRVNSIGRAQGLLKILKKNKKNNIQTIIFSNVNKTSNWAAKFLNENGVECVTLNGLDNPRERLTRIRDFECGYISAISTTNFLALGLTFPRAEHLISLEFPRYMSDYIHRCGRVGRLGQSKNCLITNFVLKKRDVSLTQKIELAVRTNSVLPYIRCPRTKE